MRLTVLGSGSSGNSVVLQWGERTLLIDAGFSCRELERRMGERDIDPDSVDAVVLTHEHGDHSRGVDRFVRRHRAPIYLTAGTREGIDFSEEAHGATELIASGCRQEAGGFEIEPFAIPHDAREPVGLVVETSDGRRIGLAADLGTRTRLAWGRMRDLDLLILEANHDLDMLRNGPYPWSLKQRVAGRHGHLSNREAAEGASELASDRLQRVVLYHLSRTNNLPALAAESVGQALEREGCGASVLVAAQDHPTEWLEIL